MEVEAPSPFASLEIKSGREYLIFFDSSVLDTETVLKSLDDMPEFQGMFMPVNVPPGKTINDVIKFAGRLTNAGAT